MNDELTGYAERLAAAQGSARWLYDRVGYLTASRFKDMLDITKTGTESAKRRNYRIDVLVERLTGQPTEHFVTQAMQAGIDLEPAARMEYERRTGAMVEQVGFCKHPTIKWLGGSPDGFVDDDGGVEFKCPQAPEHIRILTSEDVSEYLPQCCGLMWITGRKWWDFVSYCPRMPAGLEYYQRRVERDEGYIAHLADKAMLFLSEVEAQQRALEAIAAKNLPPAQPERDPLDIDIPL